MSKHTIIVKGICSFVDEQGHQCDKAIGVTHPYCEKHGRQVLGLEVKKSRIPNAGLGLYATRKIKKGQFIVEYKGEIIRTGDYNERYNDHGFGEYGMALNTRLVIDARATSSGLARYICDAFGSNLKPNVKYYEYDHHVDVIAYRDIEAGEELLVDYGDEMRIAMGIQEAPKKKSKTGKKGRPKKAGKKGRPKKAGKKGRPKKAGKKGRPAKKKGRGRPVGTTGIVSAKKTKTPGKKGRPKKNA